jgi:general L-amino acid transport system substrate-binding protein
MVANAMAWGLTFRAVGILILSGCGGLAPAPDMTAPGHTLATVKARGYVLCGANRETIGFGAPDDKGYWRGIDVDVCRAIAAAIFADREKTRFAPLTGQQRLTALQTGEIDVLPRTTTWTLQRDANGVNFTIPNYYDYTAFMARKSKGVTTLADLAGASVCIQTGSMTEISFADVSRKYRLKLRPVIFDNVIATRQAFLAGRCDALITDASALQSVRMTQTRNSDDYVIIRADDQVAPLTTAVRHGDDQWFDIVKFAIDAMIVAEQLGISRHNVDAMRKSDDPAVKRFLGIEPGNGRALGLREDFAYQIVKQVGNYAEIYADNLGVNSPLKIPRGLNRLQRDGGLMLPIGFY